MKSTLYTFLCFFGIVSGAFSQVKMNQATGIQGVERNSYLEIIRKLEPTYYQQPSNYVAIKLADAYYHLKNYEKAIYYSELAIKHDPTIPVYYTDCFKYLCEFGEYETARKIANQYLDKFGNDILTSKLDSIEVYLAQEGNYEVTNMNFNTSYDEYGMYPLIGDYKIVNSNQHQIINSVRPTIKDLIRSQSPYLYKYEPNQNESAGALTRLYTRKENSYDVISCYDPVVKEVFITSNIPTVSDADKKKANSASLKILIGKMDDNFNISGLKDFAYNSDQYSVGYPYISKEGDILYFASNMPGGYGGSDLYMCVRLLDGNWGHPINLGSTVNTSGDELFPYISPSGTLYYSSTGLSLFGGLDIVKSYKARNNVFSKPENLGAPINSNRDDFGFSFLDNYGIIGFFSSNRAGGKGGDDIYRFNFMSRKTCTDPVKNFAILVEDKKTKERIPNVHLKMTVRADGRVFEGTTDANGELHLTVEGCNDFDVETTHDFYLNNIFYYDGFKKQITVKLDKKELNNIVELENIYYDLGKYDVTPVIGSQLTKLSNLLARNPDIKIELSSHTDSRGDDASNMILSQKRAEKIVVFLEANGIPKNRLFAQGYGESQLINDCGNTADCTEFMHSKNRRTEFKIVEIGGKSVSITQGSIPASPSASKSNFKGNSSGLSLESNSIKTNKSSTMTIE